MLEPSTEVMSPPRPAWSWPERWAAWCFVLLCTALPWTIAPMSITVALCAAASVLVWVKFPSAGRERTPVDLPALGWVTALALSALFALDREGSLARLPKALFPFLVPLAATRARDPVTGRRAMAALLVSALGASIFGLISWLVSGGGFPSRARGAVGHYMTFAGQLLLITSVAAGIAVAARGRWRVLAGAVAATGTIAIACTLTRGAWIGLAVAFVAVAALLRPRLLPVLAIAAALALMLSPAPFRARAFSTFDPHDPTSRERTYMWRAGVRMFLDHPLTGVGLQDLKPLYRQYRPPEATESVGHLHSVPVQIAATLGLAGIAAFVWLVTGLFRAAAAGLARDRRRGGLAVGLRVGVTAALAGFLVAGLFEWNLGDEEILYLLFTLVGIAWAARAWPPDPVALAAVPGARAAESRA